MIVQIGAAGVGDLQQALVEAGEAIDQIELDKAIFGTSTYMAVRDYQARHVGPDGQALGEDGIVGPATMWALTHPGASGKSYVVNGWRFDSSSIRAEVRQVLQVAVGEIGVVEQPDGSNRGARVDQYTTPDLGIPWCAAFASWCYARAEHGSPFGRLLSAYKFSQWGSANGRIVAALDVPQPGDVFVILRGDLHGHVGLVTSLTDDSSGVMTVEGNSANACRGLIRPRASINLFVRPFPII